MSAGVTGIHHVTAMAGDARANLDFYARGLGLRFVKRTVNFDDPGTYHFYYGDEHGTPGTILTFFPWGAGALRGRVGTGQVAVTSFAVPAGSLAFWRARLATLGARAEDTERFGAAGIAFRDPDGLGLELVEAPGDARPGWATPDIAAAHAVRGFLSATLSLGAAEHTVRVLTEHMGCRIVNEGVECMRLAAGDESPGTLLDLAFEPTRARGTMGAGTVHHIAFRAATPAVQLEIRDAVRALGLTTTGVLDRNYFQSVYFREPGGVLFEVATDAPGFTVDEPAAELGLHLKLPAWLEAQRAEIEARVAPIAVPAHNNPRVH